MANVLWIALTVALLTLYLALWGVIASYIAGLRDEDKLEGFKTGVLLGPFGAAAVLLRKRSAPDIEVTCPHCKTRQEVAGNLDWFECWKCEERTNLTPT